MKENFDKQFIELLFKFKNEESIQIIQKFRIGLSDYYSSDKENPVPMPDDISDFFDLLDCMVDSYEMILHNEPPDFLYKIWLIDEYAASKTKEDAIKYLSNLLNKMKHDIVPETARENIKKLIKKFTSQ